MAAVRAEFRSDVLVFAAEDPVFGGGACKVARLRPHARGQRPVSGPSSALGLSRAGRTWTRSPPPPIPRWRRQRPNRRCRVAGCGYGAARSGLCSLHGQRWQRAGRPGPGRVAGSTRRRSSSPAAGRGLPDRALRLVAAGDSAVLPRPHRHLEGQRPAGHRGVRRQFAEHAVPADEIVRLDGLPPQLRLEMQYVLQCRHDERHGKTPPAVVMRVVRFLADGRMTSLLDQRRGATGALRIGRRHRTTQRRGPCCCYARRAVEDLRRRRRLGRRISRATSGGCAASASTATATLRLHRDPPAVAAGAGQAVGPLAAVDRAGPRTVRRRAVVARHPLRPVPRRRIGVDGLDRHRPAVAGALPGRPARRADRRPQRARQPHRPAQPFFARDPPAPLGRPRCPPTRCSSPRTTPSAPNGCPRALAEQVMAQVEHPDNLARLDRPRLPADHRSS